MALKRAFASETQNKRVKRLSAIATDAAGKLDVLWHDANTFSVDGAQVGVFEKINRRPAQTANFKFLIYTL